MHARANDPETEIVIDALSARVGGGVTDLLNLLPALIKEYPRLRLAIVLSSRYQGDLIDEMLPEVAVEALDVPPMPSLRRLQTLRSEVPAIVRSRHARALLSMGELVPTSPGCPMVALVRNPNFFAPWGSFGDFRKEVRGFLNRATARPFINRLVRTADHLIFVSEAFRTDACKLYPQLRPKSSVAHLGFDPAFSSQPEDDRNPPPKGRYILSVSGVAPHKNHETLIRAFAGLTSQTDFQDLTLVIAGTLLLGNVHRKLVDLARSLNVESKVLFTDRLPHNSLPAFYRSAAIHVLPSTFETFGHPYVEAMACGTPLIASDIAVAREICGNAAELFPPTDAVSLEESMKRVITDEARRLQMVERGRRRAEEFSWAHTASTVGLQLLKVSDQRS